MIDDILREAVEEERRKLLAERPKKLLTRDKDKKYACSICGSRNTLIKKRTQTRWCRRCGYECPITAPNRNSEYD